MLRGRLTTWGIACMALALAGTAAGEDGGAANPRDALLGFRAAVAGRDYTGASAYLDLSKFPASRRDALGPELARKLQVILERALAVDPSSLSDDPAGETGDGLPATLDRLGSVATPSGEVELQLHRVQGRDGAPAWKVSASTVARLPALYEQVGHGYLDRVLPRVLLDVRVLGVALWQWIGLLLLLAVAAMLSWLVAAVMLRAARPLAARSRTVLGHKVLASVGAPLRVGLALVAFSIGVLFLALPLSAGAALATLEKAGAIAVVGWALFRILDVLALLTTERLAARGSATSVTMVPVGRKAAKGVVLAFVAIAVLQNAGLNVTGILAGLGIGGLAIALAAQKTVENLFGGITLIIDQPVRVGDFCRFGERLGTVEEVGLRSTRVRTLDRTVVTVPNSEFASLQLENYALRDRIWLHLTLGLRYETTADQLRHVLVEVRRMLYAHPMVDPAPARIRFVGFGAHSLDCEVFAYVLTRDIDEFLAVQEDVLLRVMDIVAGSGTGFAFPSQTLYVRRDPGLDEARSRAAEDRVRAWRQARTMSLPDFPPDEVAAVRGTLDYPPEGSAIRRRS